MNRIIIKLKLIALSFLVSSSLYAQQKLTKVEQSIKVDKDVTIDLNTSHCNIVFDTWSKGTIEIEAFVESESLSKEELKTVLEDWVVDIDASQNKVSINTKGSSIPVWIQDYSHAEGQEDISAVLEELKFALADLPDLGDALLSGLAELPNAIVLPQIPNMPKFPALPKLPKGVNNIKFDYEAYKKDGEKYIEEYSKNFESIYGEDYAKKMEAWGEKFEKEWGEKYGKDMEKWAEKLEKQFKDKGFEEKMEAWGEKFGKNIEAWAKRFEENFDSEEFEKKVEAWAEGIAEQAEHQSEKQEKLAEKYREKAEARARLEKKRAELIAKRGKIKEEKIKKLAEDRRVLIEKLANKKSNSKVKKTIIIKMPKDAKLKINVRHGEIEFAANVDNLKADLSHTKFTAQSINGSYTSINAYYSPVLVTHWNSGELNLNYVDKAKIINADKLMLNSKSSNINIDNLNGNGVIDGNFGNITISNFSKQFKNLNLILVNSDAELNLPKTLDYSAYFKGTKSKFNGVLTSQKTISNFPNNPDANRTIVVNAKYSNVVME